MTKAVNGVKRRASALLTPTIPSVNLKIRLTAFMNEFFTCMVINPSCRLSPKLSGLLIMSAHQQQELEDLERNLDR